MTPNLLRNDLVNSLNENALVMASIENGELAVSRHLSVLSPQETMIELLRSRLLEVRDADPRRVDPLKDPANDAVLAPRMDGWQNNENVLRVLCIEALLKLATALVGLLRRSRRILLLSLEARS